LTGFRQTFVTGASWDTDDLITFLGQNSKGQSSRSHHSGGGAQHSTLPSSATFSSLTLVLRFYSALVGKNIPTRFLRKKRKYCFFTTANLGESTTAISKTVILKTIDNWK